LGESGLQKVHDGLIHDWIGAFFIPSVRMDEDLLPLRSRQHYLSPLTALPYIPPCALHYGTGWAYLNTAHPAIELA